MDKQHILGEFARLAYLRQTYTGNHLAPQFSVLEIQLAEAQKAYVEAFGVPGALSMTDESAHQYIRDYRDKSRLANVTRALSEPELGLKGITLRFPNTAFAEYVFHFPAEPGSLLPKFFSVPQDSPGVRQAIEASGYPVRESVFFGRKISGEV